MTEVAGAKSVLDFPMKRTCPFAPAPRYAELRADQPISRVMLPTGQTAWLVTRHEHVRRLLTDSRISSDRAHPNFPVPACIDREAVKNSNFASALVGLDPPEHSVSRRMVIPEFTAKRIQALRPRIQKIVDGCIDDLIAAGPGADLVQRVALPVPSMAICELLGVPYSDRDFFQARSEGMLRHSTPPEERNRSLKELTEYLDALVTAKGREPGDDLLGRLIVNNREARVFDHDRLVGMALFLLIAGHETTANVISLGTIGLLNEPSTLAELKADPAVIGTTVEELLRYFTVVDSLYRVATDDIEIGGVTIRADEGVVLGLGSANRDDDAFVNADELDIRRGARNHVAFAYGVHRCLGQNLARMELEVVFSTIFVRLPHLKLAMATKDLPYKEDAGVYGVYEIPVLW